MTAKPMKSTNDKIEKILRHYREFADLAWSEVTDKEVIGHYVFAKQQIKEDK